MGGCKTEVLAKTAVQIEQNTWNNEVLGQQRKNSAFIKSQNHTGGCGKSFYKVGRGIFVMRGWFSALMWNITTETALTLRQGQFWKSDVEVKTKQWGCYCQIKTSSKMQHWLLPASGSDNWGLYPTKIIGFVVSLTSEKTFIVYSYKYQHEDGRVSYPLCFIFSSPVGEWTL